MDSDIVLAEEQGTDVLPVSSQDLKYWACVQKVRDQFLEKGVNTTRKACKLAGVSHDFYYTSLKSPYVQSMMAQEIAALEQATHEIIQRSWVPAVINMARIAANQGSKEAVQAARFLRDVGIDIKQVVEQAQKGEVGAHPAKLLTQSYLRPRKLTRTTTVEEIELDE
jgi:hypothetical protein